MWWSSAVVNWTILAMVWSKKRREERCIGDWEKVLLEAGE